MAGSTKAKLIQAGIRVSDKGIYEEDVIWSRYSNDKVDIGEELARVIRLLSKVFPLNKPLRALSIGSSAEPQFRILETAFRGGLYLLDLDKKALDIVRERIQRQRTGHVFSIQGDYNKIFLRSQETKEFLKQKLGNKKVNLITLHHSLYYCEEVKWGLIFEHLWRYILARSGAIHAVLMVSKDKNTFSTTWLYNHFAGKFFDCYNDQDLLKLKRELKKNPVFKSAKIENSAHRVYFWVDDFSKFMAVAWMILLYPEVHRYSLKQREEITEFIYKKFWLKKQPLVQAQDHLVIYRDIYCLSHLI
jgi:hypothetical protein